MTNRQSDILRTIVETYAASAEPVSSLQVSDKFQIAPATARLDMAELERLGYITHPHTSAGRIPTDHGYRWYVNFLNGESETANPAAGRTASAIDRRIRDIGPREDQVKVAAEMLAKSTGNVAVVTLPHGFYYYGVRNLFDSNLGQANIYQMINFVENSLEEWSREMVQQLDAIQVLIGEQDMLKIPDTSAIIARFRSPYSKDSYIGLLGSSRQDYPYVLELVEHVSKSLEEALNV